MNAHPQPVHTTTIHHDESVVVRIEADGGGRWFRILNWLIDSGTWAALDRSEQSILGVLCRFRNDDGFSVVSHDDLARFSGVGRTQMFDTLRSLCARGLLAKRGHGVWEPLPGRAWAARRDAAVRPGGPQSAPPDPSPLHRTPSPPQRTAAPAPSPAPFSSPAPSDSTAAAASSASPAERRRAAAAAALVRDGFGKGDVERLLDAGGPSLVFEAIASCDGLEQARRLRTNRRSYIQAHVRGGYSLFAGVEKRLVRDMERKSAGHVGPDVLEAMRDRGFRSAADLLRARVVGIDEIDDLDGMELVGVVKQRLAQGATPR